MALSLTASPSISVACTLVITQASLVLNGLIPKALTLEIGSIFSFAPDLSLKRIHGESKETVVAHFRTRS